MDNLTISAMSPFRGLRVRLAASKRRWFLRAGGHRSRLMSRLLNRLLGVTVLLGTAGAHAGTVTYVYTNPQGTPLAEANASGVITAAFDYRPYGSPVASLGTPGPGPGYTGHVNDPDTGFVYMQARYYDPSVGAFLSRDPVPVSGGNIFLFGRYDYTNDDPIGRTDPDGRATITGSYNVSENEGSCTEMAGVGCSRRSAFENPFPLATGGGAVTQKGTSHQVKLETPVAIENMMFSEPGVPVITSLVLTRFTFETHIKPRHASDIGVLGERSAGLFKRNILNRTTSQSYFSQELGAMINMGAVQVFPSPQAGPTALRIYVTVEGSIGTTPSGASTSTVAIGIEPAGAPGKYAIVTAFPYGK